MIRSRILYRGKAVVAWLAFALLGCNELGSVSEPVAEETRIYNALELRLGTKGLQMMAPLLKQFLFMSDQTWMIPGLSEPIALPGGELSMCPEGCELTAQVTDLGFALADPQYLTMKMKVNVSGTLNGVVSGAGGEGCELPVAWLDKPMDAVLRLRVHPLDHFMLFEAGGVELTLSSTDLPLSCAPLAGLEALVLPALTEWLADAVRLNLSYFFQTMMKGMSCLLCDEYTTGCPDGSSCDEDGFCMQDGICRGKPLGVVTQLDIGSLVGGILPGLGVQGKIDLFMAPGQPETEDVVPLVRHGGMELRLVGRLGSTRNPCVPPPAASEIPSLAPSPHVNFPLTIPATGEGYMAGVGISDVLMDQALFHAYQSGALCVGLASDVIDSLLKLDSPIGSVLEGLIPSIQGLTHEETVPFRIQLRPTRVPSVQIGAGTFKITPEGKRLMDKPLIGLSLPGLGIDFYLLLSQRWVRVFTVTSDIQLKLGLDVTANNEIIPMVDEGAITASAQTIAVKHSELLQETPEQLRKLMVMAIDLALPTLGNLLKPIQVPALQGFQPRILMIRGEAPLSDGESFGHLGLYLDLESAPAAVRALDTRAELISLRSPPADSLAQSTAISPEWPEVSVKVSAEPSSVPAEYSARLDNGLWTPFAPGPRVTVQSPRLALIGKHQLEVRSRAVGDYRTLDPTPSRLAVEISRPATVVRFWGGKGAPSPAGPIGQPSLSLEEQNPTQSATGCGCSVSAGRPFESSLGLWLLAFAALLCAARRRC